MAVSSGEGFGPVGPTSGGAPPFAVAGPTQLKLDASRVGSGSFTVSNVTGRPVRARVFVQPGAGADPSWFEVTGGPERAMPVAGTATVDVAVRVPEKAPAGTFSFQLGAALEEAPDQVVSGPTASFEVPVRKKRFPWWIVIVAIVALLVLAGGGLLIWNLAGRDDEVTPTPTPEPPRAVFLPGQFTFATPTLDVDLDTGIATAGIRQGADLSLADADFIAVPDDRPMSIFAFANGVAIVDQGDFETCRVAQLRDTVEVPDDVDRTVVCTVTNEGRVAMLEITPVPGEQSVRQVTFTVWE